MSTGMTPDERKLAPIYGMSMLPTCLMYMGFSLRPDTESGPYWFVRGHLSRTIQSCRISSDPSPQKEPKITYGLDIEIRLERTTGGTGSYIPQVIEGSKAKSDESKESMVDYEFFTESQEMW